MKNTSHITLEEIVSLLEGQMEPEEEFIWWDHIENCYQCARAVGAISAKILNSTVSTGPAYAEVAKYLGLNPVVESKSNSWRVNLEESWLDRLLGWLKPSASCFYVVAGVIATLFVVISWPTIKHFHLSFITDETFKASQVKFVLDPVDRPIVIKTNSPEEALLSLYTISDKTNATIVKVVSIARNQELVVIRVDSPSNHEVRNNSDNLSSVNICERFVKELSSHFQENITIPDSGFNDKRGNLVILIQNESIKN